MGFHLTRNRSEKDCGFHVGRQLPSKALVLHIVLLEFEDLGQQGVLHVEAWIGHYPLQEVHSPVPGLRLAVHQQLSKRFHAIKLLHVLDDPCQPSLYKASQQTIQKSAPLLFLFI